MMHVPRHRLRGIFGLSMMGVAWVAALALAVGTLALAGAQPLEARSTLQQATTVPEPTTGIAVPDNPGASDAVPGGAPQGTQPGQSTQSGIPAQAGQQAAAGQPTEPLAPPLVFLLLMALLFGVVLAFSFKARQDAVR